MIPGLPHRLCCHTIQFQRLMWCAQSPIAEIAISRAGVVRQLPSRGGAVELMY